MLLKLHTKVSFPFGFVCDIKTEQNYWHVRFQYFIASYMLHPRKPDLLHRTNKNTSSSAKKSSAYSYLDDLIAYVLLVLSFVLSCITSGIHYIKHKYLKGTRSGSKNKRFQYNPCVCFQSILLGNFTFKKNTRLRGEIAYQICC